MKLIKIVITFTFLAWVGHFLVPSTSTTIPAAQATTTPDLQLISQSTSTDGYVSYVTGTIKNNTSRNYSYVQVEINEYDKSGAQVGSTMTNMNNMEPNGTWKFKAPVIDKDVVKFQIKDITGF